MFLKLYAKFCSLEAKYNIYIIKINNLVKWDKIFIQTFEYSKGKFRNGRIIDILVVNTFEKIKLISLKF